MHKRRAELGKVLEYWLLVENENLIRVKTGLLKFRMPHTYETNRPADDQGWSISTMSSPTKEAQERVVDQLVEYMDWFTLQLFN